MYQIVGNATRLPASQHFFWGYPIVRIVFLLLCCSLTATACSRSRKAVVPELDSSATPIVAPTPNPWVVATANEDASRQQRIALIQTFLATLQPEPGPMPALDAQPTIFNNALLTLTVVEGRLFTDTHEPTLDNVRQMVEAQVIHEYLAQPDAAPSHEVWIAYQRHRYDPIGGIAYFEFLVSVYAFHD
jgi:hypothetical protein